MANIGKNKILVQKSIGEQLGIKPTKKGLYYADKSILVPIGSVAAIVNREAIYWQNRLADTKKQHGNFINDIVSNTEALNDTDLKG